MLSLYLLKNYFPLLIDCLVVPDRLIDGLRNCGTNTKEGKSFFTFYRCGGRLVRMGTTQGSRCWLTKVTNGIETKYMNEPGIAHENEM